MKASLLVGRLWGTEIRLHASLLLLIPYALLTFRTNRLEDTLSILLLITAVFVCVAFHELGHTLAARLFGIEVKSIVLWPLGGVANLSRRPENVLKDLVISAAGPLTNLAIFVLLGLLAWFVLLLQRSLLFPRLSDLLQSIDAVAFLAGLTLANLALGLFNLAPIFPLDGGQIVHSLLKKLLGERRAGVAMIVVSLPLALLLTGLGLLLNDVLVILSGLGMALAILMLSPRLSEELTYWVLYFLDRGGYHLKRGDYDQSIRAYSYAIARSPERAGLYISRAVAYLNLNDIERAKEDVRAAIRLDGKHPIAWTLAGEIMMIHQQPQRALDALNRAIDFKAGWPVAYLDRATVYQQLGRCEEARADLDHAIELEPGAPLSYLLRARLRFQTCDRTGARADAVQALAYAPRWMLTFSEVFLNNFKGYLPWALDYYALAMERLPNQYQVYQGRGDAYRVNGAPQWALSDYSRAVLLAPRQAEPYLKRGSTFLALGYRERAMQDLTQAARLAKHPHLRRQAEALLEQAARLPTAAGPAIEGLTAEGLPLEGAQTERPPSPALPADGSPTAGQPEAGSPAGEPERGGPFPGEPASTDPSSASAPPG